MLIYLFFPFGSAGRDLELRLIPFCSVTFLGGEGKGKSYAFL